MPDHNYFANLIWQIADLLRGPYRPPRYERVMLPMTVLRRFDCVLTATKTKVFAEHERSQKCSERRNDGVSDALVPNLITDDLRVNGADRVLADAPE